MLTTIISIVVSLSNTISIKQLHPASTVPTVKTATVSSGAIFKKEVKINKAMIYFVENNLDHNCVGITRLLNREYKFLILSKNVSKYEILTCLNIWGRTKDYERLRQFRLIYTNETKKLNLIKKILKKKGIKLFLVQPNKQKFYRDLMHLYNTFEENKFNIYLQNDRILVDKKTLRKFIEFSKNYEKYSKEFIEKMNKFLTENNIKQDIYKGWGSKFSVLVKSDGVKCNTYTLTQLVLFNQFLENKIYGFNENIFTREHFYQVFNDIDDYRIKLNEREKYVGWTNQDIANYLNGLSWGFLLANGETKTFKWKYMSDFFLFKFLYVESKDGQYAHSGWKICVSSSECYMYFPDFGKYVKQTPTRKFLGHTVLIYGDLAPVMSSPDSLTF